MDRPWALLALAWVAGFTLIDSSIVSLALPAIARDFDRSVGDLAWVSTGFLLALAASLLAAGRLADRYGQRRVMAAGAIGFGLTTLLCGLVPAFELLVATRVAQGVFGGILYTVSLALAATAFPPERRATALSIYFTSGALGAVVGPLLGGWLTEVGGWRLVFFAQLPLPVLIVVMTLALLSRVAIGRGALDVPGIVAASAFIATATFALLQLPAPGGAPVALLSGVTALVALVAFVAIERRSSAPAVRLSIFRNADFVVGSLAGAGAWFTIMSTVVYVAIYLQLGRGFDAATAGMVLLGPPAVALAFFPFGGRVVGRLGAERTMLYGLAVMLAAAAAMVGWDARADVAWLFVVLLANGAGIAVTLVASATGALAQFAPREAGTGSAVFNMLRQLGAALGVAAPAVAFEFVAHGSRTAGAVLSGSTAAFALRLVVVAIPLVVVLARNLSLRAPEATDRAA